MNKKLCLLLPLLAVVFMFCSAGRLEQGSKPDISPDSLKPDNVVHLSGLKETTDSVVYRSPGYESTIIFYKNAKGTSVAEKWRNGIIKDSLICNDIIRDFVDTDCSAEYAQGTAALHRDLNKNFKYPALALKNNMTGELYIKMSISVDGKVEKVYDIKNDMKMLVDGKMLSYQEMPTKNDINVYEKAATQINKEVARVLYKLGPWKTRFFQKWKTAEIKWLSFKVGPSGLTLNTSPDNTIYNFCDQSPEFGMGDDYMLFYINKFISYPLEAKANNVMGKVYMKILIDKYGRCTDQIVVKSDMYRFVDGQTLRRDELKTEEDRVLFDKCCRDIYNEEMRIIQDAQWKPGKVDGMNVNSWKYLPPVNFVIM